MSGAEKSEVEKTIDPIAEDLSGTPRPTAGKGKTPVDPDDESGFQMVEKVEVKVEPDTPPLKTPDSGVS
jgi:hypothetical protein